MLKICSHCDIENRMIHNNKLCQNCGNVISKTKKLSAMCVYMIECKNDTIYTGITNNIAKRFEQHTLGLGAKYTSKNKIKKLLGTFRCDSRSAAMFLERLIKTFSHDDKRELVKHWNNSPKTPFPYDIWKRLK